MKDLDYRIEYDEFKKDTEGLFSELPSSSIEIVLENAKFLGKPRVVWIHQNRLESVVIAEAKNYIHVHIFREDGKGVMEEMRQAIPFCNKSQSLLARIG